MSGLQWLEDFVLTVGRHTWIIWCLVVWNSALTIGVAVALRRKSGKT